MRRRDVLSGLVRGSTTTMLAALAVASCSGPEGVSLLPPAPTDGPVQEAPIAAQPSFKKGATGQLQREVVAVTKMADDAAVQVRDWMILPDQKEADLGVEGAALFEVFGGTGTARVGQEAIKLEPGAMFAVPDGEKVVVSIDGSEAMTLRGHVVRVK